MKIYPWTVVLWSSGEKKGDPCCVYQRSSCMCVGGWGGYQPVTTNVVWCMCAKDWWEKKSSGKYVIDWGLLLVCASVHQIMVGPSREFYWERGDWETMSETWLIYFMWLLLCVVCCYALYAPAKVGYCYYNWLFLLLLPNAHCSDWKSIVCSIFCKAMSDRTIDLEWTTTSRGSWRWAWTTCSPMEGSSKGWSNLSELELMDA